MQFVGKLSRDKRGIGSLVGAAFLILILGTGFALYILNQRTAEHYDQTLQEMEELDYDRSREKIVIEEVVVTGAGKLDVTVKNEGPISSHLILLGVYNETLPPQYYELDKQVNPSETETDIGLTEMEDGVVFEENQYTIQVITELGNIAVYSYPPEKEVVKAQTSQGIGPLALDFDNFRYFTYESPQKLRNYPDGSIGFNVPKGEYAAFGCFLTNMDYPNKRTIIIDSHSLFFQPGRTGVDEGTWFIVNVDADGTIKGTYTPISMEYGETKMLVFASKFDLGVGSFARLKTGNAVTTVATFYLLHGTIGSIAFAQTIPYVSLFYC